LQQVPEGSQNVKGFINSFAFIYLVYCRIWLNVLGDKSQIQQQNWREKEKKKEKHWTNNETDPRVSLHSNNGWDQGFSPHFQILN
jgi:hypothetical protein